jgi:hypothetical protein
MAVSNTEFYALYIDHGNGRESFGVYTLVEETDDPVLETDCYNEECNLYKPEYVLANLVKNVSIKKSLQRE